ncbi:protein PHLOEM PROTEIN 2-LIKE A1-like isoform X2 [Typha angustifolia]|uniref:protein PHLOEM PROTEIN 2-LIKE A1-like isoform X2 n=1 Tax=Typha angustifolia TaxID=59011 RepID=UPI003C2CAF87
MATEGSKLTAMRAVDGDVCFASAARKDFMLYPRNLSIAWSGTKQYWTWTWIKSDSENTLVEVPRLVKVWWLEATGSFDMSELIEGTKYSIVFKVMKKDPCEGWKIPVNLTLNLPNEMPSSTTASLDEMPVDIWADLHVGDFVAFGAGLINFSMRETTNTNPKSGLIIKGVQIKPI